MKLRLLSMLVLAQALAGSAAEPFRQIVTSTSRGIRTDQWTLTHRDLGLPSPWSIRKLTLHGGRQEGVEVIVVDNGLLTFTVIPTRGMGILEATAGDVRLGWDSPVKEVVHPNGINLESRGGLGWLEGFNEWMVRCGVEWAGHPGKDSFVNNTGDRAEMSLTLHGRIANIPASEVEVLVDPNPPFRLRVRGRVDERMFYGPKLELWTEVSTDPGSPAFRIEDVLTNHGAHDQEYQMIYHCNFGAPLLQAGSRFVGAVRRVTPFNGHAARDVERYAEYGGPTLGFVEQVYCIEPASDSTGRSLAMLQSPRADRGVALGFSVAELPSFTLWKNLAATQEGYVTGLEPGTGFPFNRRVERLAGRVPKLAPGAQKRMGVDVTVLLSREDVGRAANEIKRLQGGRDPQIDKEPFATP
ncbi:MAG: aldose 1-epimerase family protein [Verrucomicrobiales bacterium]|nr:aldose 1-epimerase family protein [Verrucomicrobiales bacterium]